MKSNFIVTALVLAALTMPIAAQATALKLVLDLPGNADQHVTKYQCTDQEELRAVTYVNADPNFLAILTIQGEQLIMASTISASGVQYVAGQYKWSTKGADASLHDLLLGPDAAPIATCLEATDIP